MDINKLKPLVNNDLIYSIFKEYLEDRISSLYKLLVNQDNEKSLYRYQGAIKELQELKSLREKVNAK